MFSSVISCEWRIERTFYSSKVSRLPSNIQCCNNNSTCSAPTPHRPAPATTTHTLPQAPLPTQLLVCCLSSWGSWRKTHIALKIWVNVWIVCSVANDLIRYPFCVFPGQCKSDGGFKDQETVESLAKMVWCVWFLYARRLVFLMWTFTPFTHTHTHVNAHIADLFRLRSWRRKLHIWSPNYTSTLALHKLCKRLCFSYAIATSVIQSSFWMRSYFWHGRHVQKVCGPARIWYARIKSCNSDAGFGANIGSERSQNSFNWEKMSESKQQAYETSSEEDSVLASKGSATAIKRKKVPSQKFLPAYHEASPCLVLLRKGSKLVLCTTCKSLECVCVCACA